MCTPKDLTVETRFIRFYIKVGYPPFSSIQIEYLLAALVILFHTKRGLKLRAGCAFLMGQNY